MIHPFSNTKRVEVDKHQPAKCEDTLTEEEFNSQIETHQEHIRCAASNISADYEDYDNLNLNIQKALSPDALNTSSIVEVARDIYFGRGFTVDKFLPLEIMKTIAIGFEHSKHPSFQYLYALLLFHHGDPFETACADIIEKLSIDRFLPAVVRYGTFLDGGFLGIDKNKILAEQHYRYAAKAGHVRGLGYLASINRKKKNIVSKGYGWLLLIKIVLIAPIFIYRMNNSYDVRDHWGWF